MENWSIAVAVAVAMSASATPAHAKKDRITAGFSADERRALFHDNAARFYRL